MQEFTKFATPVITIPDKMEGTNKKGENVMVKTLTKKGNIKSLNGEKSIKIKADKNTKEIVTLKLSKKLQNDIDKLEGVIKERKPRKKKEVNEDKPKKERKPRKKKEEAVV